MIRKTCPIDAVGLVLSCTLVFCARAQTSQVYTFSTLAGVNFGTASSGGRDGNGTNALFFYPTSVAVFNATNIYVSDYFNHTIRRMNWNGTNWQVTTFAGQYRVPGYTNATGTNALFTSPYGVAVDAGGNVIVADRDNSVIRKITPAGLVSTLAGQAGVFGERDGTGTNAWFDRPFSVAVDGASNVYVADTDGDTIRWITPEGVVTTLAGKALVTGATDADGTNATFNFPRALAVDVNTNIFVADTGNDTIRRISLTGGNWAVTTLSGQAQISGHADGTGTNALYTWPAGIVVDSAGIIYVADSQNDTLRKISAGGVVTTLAGQWNNAGSCDGTGTNALFNGVAGLALSGTTNLFAADMYNNLIRKITQAGGVTTIAGIASSGSRDGPDTYAQFNQPYQLALDRATNVYVADTENNAIRKISAAGEVTTIAGQAIMIGSADGTGTNALFRGPSGIVVDSATNLYVADSYNNTIRKITPAGVVTTIAGQAAITGYDDGTGTNALFSDPFGLAIDGATNLYVADGYNHLIRKISPVAGKWVTTTLAGKAGLAGGFADGTGTNAQFDIPYCIAVDKATNLYVADTYNSVIRKMNLVEGAWVVSTIAGSTNQTGSADGTGTNAAFNLPTGIAVDDATNVYVADQENNTIRQLTLSGTNWGVTTVAGRAANWGSSEGTAYNALFQQPGGVTVDGAGNLYVSDTLNNCIRFGLVRPLPVVHIAPAGTNVVLTWPSWTSEFVLESDDNVTDPSDYWSAISSGIFLSGTNFVLTNGINPGNAFFRLQLP